MVLCELQALKARIQQTTEHKLWETENLAARLFALFRP